MSPRPLGAMSLDTQASPPVFSNRFMTPSVVNPEVPPPSGISGLSSTRLNYGRSFMVLERTLVREALLSAQMKHRMRVTPKARLVQDQVVNLLRSQY